MVESVPIKNSSIGSHDRACVAATPVLSSFSDALQIAKVEQQRFGMMINIIEHAVSAVTQCCATLRKQRVLTDIAQQTCRKYS